MSFRFVVSPWIVLPFIALGIIVVMAALYRARKEKDGSEISWIRRLLMVVMVGAIGMTPTIREEGVELTTNTEVYIVVDRTGSMAAEEYNGTQQRLEGVKADINALVEAFAGGRFTIIAWDSTSTTELPFTTDGRAVGTWAETLHQETSYYSAGSAVDRPLQALQRSLERGMEQNPQNVRLVFFFSDGENTDGDSTTDTGSTDGYSALADFVDGGAVLGYGTEEGGQMLQYGLSQLTSYIIDPATGEPAISRIDEENLNAIATNLGIDYMHRTAPSSFEDFAAGIDVQEIAAADERTLSQIYRDVYWPFAWALGLLIAWEAYHQVLLLRQMGDTRDRKK